MNKNAIGRIARKQRMGRFAYGNLLDSLDFCDATRSHEFQPSWRLRGQYRFRRFVRTVTLSAAGLVTLALAVFGL